MIDPRDLLGQRPPPAPFAVEMPTEIRTDGGLMFQILQAPAWAMPNGAAVIAEWSCRLKRPEIRALRDFLARPDATTGLQPEAAIDHTLRRLNFNGQATRIGHLIGIFVAEGTGFLIPVRFMFAYTPTLLLTVQDVNRALFELLTFKTPNPVRAQASAALKQLRTFWLNGDEPTESRWMMLSQTDPANPEQNPFFAAGT